MTTLFEVGADDVADTSNDRYTPRWIFDAAGLLFDMDVAAPVDSARRTCPARRHLTPLDDGLTQPWEGLVWMNPPYSNSAVWVDRFTQHACGLALVPSYPEVMWLGTLLQAADALALLSPRYVLPGDKQMGKAPFASLLVGCGLEAVAAVPKVAAADKYIRGAYHVRPGWLT